MIDEPIRFLQDYKACGADVVTVHAEACKHLHRTVSAIKRNGNESRRSTESGNATIGA